MTRTRTLIMLLCCLIPVAGLSAVLVFKVPLDTVLVWGLILLCPLSHLWTMRILRRDHAAVEPSGHAPAESPRRP